MRISSKALFRPLAAACLIAALTGCGNKTDAQSTATGSATSPAKPTPSGAPSPGATTAANSAPKGAAIPADWVDLDLSPAGKAWAEYTLKGPAGAKVKKGFPDPSIELGDYGLVLSFTHTKKSTASLDTAKAYGVSWKALTDTEDLFEYQTSGEQNGEKFVRFNFDVFTKVDGKAIGCGGLNNQKEREKNAVLMAACRTLRKK